MPEPTSRLPARPSLEQLRKQAKERLATLRAVQPSARLAEAQFALALDYGFESWPKLVHHVMEVDAQASTPRITAPVSRHLGAKDVHRTVGFWRDILGFQLRDAGASDRTLDLISGEAHIRIGESDWPPDFSEGPKQPGSAIIFLQTNDVEAMRAAVRARGGEASEIEKVNWMKMRMFQIRDPDGHIIWFGQSYQRDGVTRPPRMVTKAIPELPLDDVAAGVRHYRDALGFEVNYEQHDLGVMDRDEARLLLIARTKRHGGIGSAFFYVRDVDTLYTELVEKGADVQEEPISRPWGIREFIVLDIEANRLTFGQTFE
jgi:predicted enzyme related to lactoylglutathione lyase